MIQFFKKIVEYLLLIFFPFSKDLKSSFLLNEQIITFIKL